jgi:pyruvate-ferredoxin/flavodoxin oxidoreductase
VSVISIESYLPGQTKRAIIEKGLEFYVIDAEHIATSVGLRGRINMVMQTVFFYLSKVLPMEKAITLLKNVVEKTFFKKGAEVVAQNHQCIDQSIASLIRVTPPDAWKGSVPRAIPVFPEVSKSHEYFTKIGVPVLGLRGTSELKVSDLITYAGGALPTATTKYEKRFVCVVVKVFFVFCFVLFLLSYV